MPTRQQKLADIETKMNRWMARSMRASNAIRKLQKQRHRLLKGPTDQERRDRKAMDVLEGRALGGPDFDATRKLGGVSDLHIAEQEKNDDLTIPPELNRADPLIAERMTAARKKAEAEARKAMPLTGKAALDYIKAPRKRKA